MIHMSNDSQKNHHGLKRGETESSAACLCASEITLAGSLWLKCFINNRQWRHVAGTLNTCVFLWTDSFTRQGAEGL